MICQLCRPFLFHFVHFLIHNRAHIAQCFVPAFAIIEHLNIIENIFFAIFKCFIYFLFNPFRFQTPKEAFQTSVIPAITFPAHTAHNLIILKQILEVTSSILNALGQIAVPPAQDELTSVMKGGGDLCKEARDILNRGKKNEDEHVLCPACRTYLGIRKDLSSRPWQDKAAREPNHLAIIGNVWYRCPGCGKQVLVS